MLKGDAMEANGSTALTAVRTMIAQDGEVSKALCLTTSNTTVGTTSGVNAYNYYPSGYYGWVSQSFCTHDKTACAFKIAKKLLISKIVKANSIESFIKLVDTIESTL